MLFNLFKVTQPSGGGTRIPTKEWAPEAHDTDPQLGGLLQRLFNIHNPFFVKGTKISIINTKMFKQNAFFPFLQNFQIFFFPN